MPQDVYVSILAGGSGTRFWPKSRHKRPKQLCALGDSKKSMLEVTLSRLDGFVPAERRMIVTHRDQAEATAALTRDTCPLILAEPEARNTAAALALAALEIKAMAPKGSNPIMISLHADHVIRDTHAFRRVLQEAVAVAREGKIALLGIVPTHPETGFGYIEQGNPLPIKGVMSVSQVASFREKPALEVATQYVKSGRFFWNAGLFIWQVDTILSELRQFLPDTMKALDAACAAAPEGRLSQLPASTLASTYASLKKISIDVAVLEKSTRTAVLPIDMGWKDVGSWDALRSTFGKGGNANLTFGDTMLFDCERVTVDTDGPLVACLGVKDLVVVVSGGAVMVCPESRAQEVKRFVEELQASGRKEYL
jgi:mannose-1-phosphate guanylyltransferase